MTTKAKKDSAAAKSTPRIVNRKARHNYQILDSWEVGIVLLGHEVKSIRAGQITLTEAYVRIINNEVWLMGAHINPYKNAGYVHPDPVRPRKLLMHSKDIKRLVGKIAEKGLALIPLTLYFNDSGKIKLEIGLGQGKNVRDKRQDLKARDQAREMARSKSSFKHRE